MASFIRVISSFLLIIAGIAPGKTFAETKSVVKKTTTARAPSCTCDADKRAE